jgi:PKD repeat protein
MLKTLFLLGITILSLPAFCHTTTLTKGNPVITQSGDWCKGDFLLTVNYNKDVSTVQWSKDGVAIAGANSMSFNPTSHGAGTYTVTMNSAKGVVTASYELDETPEPTANFEIVYNYAAAATNFKDSSVPGDAPITEWSWNFGDGKTSVQQNPEHFYAQQGPYTVQLTVVDAQGCSSSVSKTVNWFYPRN